MLDMGFIEDIETIVAATPATRQTLLFSATLAGSVGKLAVRMLRSPQRIEVSPARAKHDHIEQRLHFADDLAHKNRLLSHLLRDVAVNQAVVFTARASARALWMQYAGAASRSWWPPMWPRVASTSRRSAT